jgi:hypothetical protein
VEAAHLEEIKANGEFISQEELLNELRIREDEIHN